MKRENELTEQKVQDAETNRDGDFKRVDVLENQDGIYGIAIGNRRVKVFTISRDESL